MCVALICAHAIFRFYLVFELNIHGYYLLFMCTNACARKHRYTLYKLQIFMCAALFTCDTPFMYNPYRRFWALGVLFLHREKKWQYYRPCIFALFNLLNQQRKAMWHSGILSKRVIFKFRQLDIKSTAAASWHRRARMFSGALWKIINSS